MNRRNMPTLDCENCPVVYRCNLLYIKLLGSLLCMFLQVIAGHCQSLSMLFRIVWFPVIPLDAIDCHDPILSNFSDSSYQ